MAKATDAAKKAADEQDVNLEQVEGSGESGKVTKADVMAAAEEPEAYFYAEFNPRLKRNALVVEGFDGQDVKLERDDPQTRLMSQSEFDFYNSQFRKAFKPLLKGGGAS